VGFVQQMWPLRSFRFDEHIEADEVLVLDETWGEEELMARDAAVAEARSRGVNLVARWPAEYDNGPPACFYALVTEPVRWERLSVGGAERGQPPRTLYHEGHIDPDDEAAWRSAAARFRRTGEWFPLWRTCQVCGCVLCPARRRTCATTTGEPAQNSPSKSGIGPRPSK
jgi:hypothetical protein